MEARRSTSGPVQTERHAGNTSAAELIALQRSLARQVIREDDSLEPVATVAGVDVAFPDGGAVTRAAAVLMSFPALELLEHYAVEQPTELPYIPGLLSFRELPAVLAALAGLNRQPDLVLCDGQGLAHPRRFGIACHLGVSTGLMTIGVGKSRLCGSHQEPGPNKGDTADLIDRDECIGKVLRSRAGVRPIYVSLGHRVSLERAVALVLACTPRYRLPEPIRRADHLAGRR
jgi:deoxyribonuclease V